MKLKIILIASILFLFTSCANNMRTVTQYDPQGNVMQVTSSEETNYGSHTVARVKFKEADTKRIQEQSKALSQLGENKSFGTPVEQILFSILIAEKIASLEPQEYNEEAPATTEDMVMHVSDNAFDAGKWIFGMGKLADVVTEGIRGAGDGTRYSSTGDMAINTADNGSTITTSSTTTVSTELTSN